MFKCQEKSRKQFPPLGSPNKVVQGAVQIGRRCFNPVEWLVKLVNASFSARKDLESSFHHCGGPVKLVHASFSAKKDLESSFHSCGVPVKLVLASFSARKNPYSTFDHRDVL